MRRKTAIASTRRTTIPRSQSVSEPSVHGSQRINLLFVTVEGGNLQKVEDQGKFGREFGVSHERLDMVSVREEELKTIKGNTDQSGADLEGLPEFTQRQSSLRAASGSLERQVWSDVVENLLLVKWVEPLSVTQ